jgi:predicted Kef-type K+ transport protein
MTLRVAATIVAGLGLAFVFGAIANRFRIPPLVGYLIAGVLVGPNTPASLPMPASPLNWPRSA